MMLISSLGLPSKFGRASARYKINTNHPEQHQSSACRSLGHATASSIHRLIKTKQQLTNLLINNCKSTAMESYREEEDRVDNREMPLLSRQKRDLARAQQGPSTALEPASPTGSELAPLCQSPLFGLRRQITSNSNQQQTTSNIHSSTRSSQHPTSSSTTSQSNKITNDNLRQPFLQELPQEITKQQIHYAFALMDTNSDGMIDLCDLSQMLANLGIPIDESILTYIIMTVSRRGKSIAMI